MARIEPLGIHEVDDEIRHLCEEAERQSGTSASTRTYARNPVVVKALAAFRATLVREGTIDPALRELVRLKIAAIDDETSDLLSPRERAGIRFAEKLALDHHKVDDAFWSEMRSHFSEAEIIELVAHTTLYIGFGRFNEIVGVDPA